MNGKKIGILGGTFDPPHRGHLALALAARGALGLERTLLMPTNLPPHKQASATAEERLRMCALLAEGAPGVEACDIELGRSGPTYTVDTLEELRAREPDARLVYIIGGDTLFELPKWRDFARVARLCSFAAAKRPGVEGALEAQAERLGNEYGAEITLLPFSGPEISSTRAREEARAGRPLAALLPEPVSEYVRMRGLYRDAWDREKVESYVTETLSPHRVRHSLGVERQAAHLAGKYGANVDKARLAGLAHDIAKELPDDMLLSEARRYGLEPDEYELREPGLIHGRVGACRAREVFAWRDEEILEAIAWHVTGQPGLGDLPIIVNLADITEEYRGYPKADEVRQAAEESLYGGMACAIARIAVFILWDKRHVMHPVTIQFYNEMLRKHQKEARP